MSDSQQAAAPESGNPENDPEIAALLDFEPVPRKTAPVGAWTPEAQRLFIARLAVTGSQGKACGEIGKDRGGATKLYRSPEAGSFRAAWHAAIELYERRQAERLGKGPPPRLQPPTVDGRRKPSPSAPLSAQLDVNGNAQQPGRVLNEYDEWEDEASYLRRGEEAMDSIGNKLVRSRRLYLMSISPDPLKRAAFEILTELPVDWVLAEKMEPQPFEPWTRTNAHEPDMVLTAESGWSFGEIGYGPDKKAQLRAAINEDRAERGLPPIEQEEA